jgi:hypothetical protein
MVHPVPCCSCSWTRMSLCCRRLWMMVVDLLGRRLRMRSSLQCRRQRMMPPLYGSRSSTALAPLHGGWWQPASLLQSHSSVRRVVERNEIYTLVCGKTFLWLSHTLSPANLPELLHVVVGADMSSFQECGGRPCGMVDTWKQAVTQLFLRKVLPANHQKNRPSDSGSIQINNILAFPPFLPLGRSSLQNINRPEFPQSWLPPSLSIITIPQLFSLYLHCNAYEFWMVSMLETNDFGSWTQTSVTQTKDRLGVGPKR